MRTLAIDHAQVSFAIQPLTCFAGTLVKLVLDDMRRRVGSRGVALRDDVIAQLEATLAQLTALQCVHIAALPTARCFLGGRHTALQEVLVGDVDAPFAALVAACPRLLYAMSDNAVSSAPRKVPVGWLVLEYGPCFPKCVVLTAFHAD